MKDFIDRLVFFIGWLLSPFTFWNDTFINIPISYLAASVLARFVQIRFVTLMVVCYWLSNVVGLAMMYGSGKALTRKGQGIVRELVIMSLTIAAYSLILILLAKAGFLKPI